MSARRRDEAIPESDVLDGALAPRANKTLFGHLAAEQAFLDAYKVDRLPHAWLIGGRPGIGKATFAWRIARFRRPFPTRAVPNFGACAGGIALTSLGPEAGRTGMRMYLDQGRGKASTISSGRLEALGAASALALVSAALWLLFSNVQEARALRELVLATPL